MTGLDAAARRRAILALAMGPCADPAATAARVVELAADVPDVLGHWSELCLAVDKAGSDAERIVAMAVAAGEILDRLVPLPPAPGSFTVTVDEDTVPLYLGRVSR
ncbi:hypothetical protein [Parafrankia sp. EUN1f]|uniref:hypothetical protein n=1 Tax=Parafrankia sp. EUN1f TaxID=102897 RepID=UPI0001C456C9|nr:hypothetical protein [Parafrankia sp. EUN1f]EFC78838.1 hypothetical protein FrEUN1fDRAFT_8043 [Parafrankia sp. EUN1f]